MALGPIDRGKYADFAARFFRKDGRPFEVAAFAHLYDRFDGVTWYVQAVLNRAWAAGGGLVSAAQVDEAVEKLEADGFLIGFERAQEIYRNSYGELVRRYASESSETESSGGL